MAAALYARAGHSCHSEAVCPSQLRKGGVARDEQETGDITDSCL